MLQKSKKWLVLFVALAGFAACAHIAPVEEVRNAPIPSGPHQLSSKEVGSVIAKAAISRGWTVAQVTPNKLHAKILRHDSYEAEANISYTEKSYSITLASSKNLDQDNKGQIAPAYNRWVEYLKSDIDTGLNQAVFN